MLNRVSPKIGQVMKQGGERYEAVNVGSTDLKAGDPLELVSGDSGRIGVQKWATGECIGFVVSETIDYLIKPDMALTYASSHTFIALNAVSALDVKDKVKANANGVTEATLPADADLVVGTVYKAAAINGIAIIKLSVE